MLREWELVAADKEIEVAPGVTFPAWTYNGRVPGPTLRCTRGRAPADHASSTAPRTRTRSTSTASTRPRWTACPAIGAGIIEPGESTVYEFDAEPFGLHLYHCHVGPLAEHIARGMYGTFIVDPEATGRAGGRRAGDGQNGFNTNFDAEGNQLYAVNGDPLPLRQRADQGASATSWCGSTS